jgi:hypothetical protein
MGRLVRQLGWEEQMSKMGRIFRQAGREKQTQDGSKS